MAGDFLLYGSNGYVGSAVAETAIERGLRPLLGGRNRRAIELQAKQLDLDFAIAETKDSRALDEAMADVPVVLSCAGPFLHTAEPMVEACLRTGTHYLDITGEPPVYEMIAAHHDRAVASGVMLLPSVGFDVAPTDCLAVHLVQRLPTATRLTIALNQEGPAGLPPGTLNTVIDLAPYATTKDRRVDGVVVSEPRRPTRMVDFGDGPVQASMITWGDVFTAHRSTGIPNIEDYYVLSSDLAGQLDRVDRLRQLLRFGPVRTVAKWRLRGGSTPAERALTTMTVLAQVTDDKGGRAAARLHGPEGGLEWTSRVALDVLGHVLAGQVTPGFQTPAMAYGPDLVLETDGVRRVDVE